MESILWPEFSRKQRRLCLHMGVGIIDSENQGDQ